MSRITADDVRGDQRVRWLGADGRVWKLIAYSSEPTATFENESGERISGTVTSPLVRDLVRLVPATMLGAPTPETCTHVAALGVGVPGKVIHEIQRCTICEAEVMWNGREWERVLR